jgi:tail tube protein
MPQPSFRSFIGIAKDSVNTTLSAAVAVGATTLPVVGTGIAASTTVVIVDGPLSEVRAVSGGGGTSSLTVAALTNAHPANTYVYAQLTASVGPTDYFPVTSLEFKDNYAQLDDKGLRGSNVDTYNRIQGTVNSEISLGGDLYTDTIGYLLGGIFGATDFTGGTPNTHAFSVKNTGNGQPTPFVLYDFDVTNTRAFAGSKFSELAFKLDPAGLVTWTAKGMGMSSAVVSNPTASYSTVTASPAWQAAATIGGTAVLTVVSADVTIKRELDAIQTLDGTQNPYSIFQGRCSASGSMTIVMEDDTQLLNYLSASQPALDLTLTTGTGASQQYFQLHFTKCNYDSAVPKQGGKSYIELDIAFTGVANTTDATTAGTGYSPLKATIKNSKATGTFQ